MCAPKKPVWLQPVDRLTVTLERVVVEEAKALGLNVSLICRDALRHAVLVNRTPKKRRTA